MMHGPINIRVFRSLYFPLEQNKYKHKTPTFLDSLHNNSYVKLKKKENRVSWENDTKMNLKEVQIGVYVVDSSSLWKGSVTSLQAGRLVASL